MAKKKQQDKTNKIIGMLLIGFIAFGLIVTFISEHIWVLFLLILAAGLFIYYKITQKKKRTIELQQKKQHELERTSTVGGLFNEFASNPQAFEKYVADLYSKLGYETHTTKGSNDGGKDIVMYKDGECHVVEVKLYATNNKIGREKIQKLHSAMIDTNAQHAIYVTTSEFTQPAIEYAEKFNIKLITSHELVEMINQVKSTF